MNNKERIVSFASFCKGIAISIIVLSAIVAIILFATAETKGYYGSGLNAAQIGYGIGLLIGGTILGAFIWKLSDVFCNFLLDVYIIRTKVTGKETGILTPQQTPAEAGGSEVPDAEGDTPISQDVDTRYDVDTLDDDDSIIFPAEGALEPFAYLNQTELTEVNIPNGITSIGMQTFAGCSQLNRVVIPGSVHWIDRCAFLDCTSLAEIVYRGTKAEWGNITRLAGWNQNTGEYVIHCNDGDLLKPTAKK